MNSCGRKGRGPNPADVSLNQNCCVGGKNSGLTIETPPAISMRCPTSLSVLDSLDLAIIFYQCIVKITRLEEAVCFKISSCIPTLQNRIPPFSDCTGCGSSPFLPHHFIQTILCNHGKTNFDSDFYLLTFYCHRPEWDHQRDGTRPTI